MDFLMFLQKIYNFKLVLLKRKARGIRACPLPTLLVRQYSSMIVDNGFRELFTLSFFLIKISCTASQL